MTEQNGNKKLKGRIAILTGGGDCPGLNAVVRGVVKTAIIEHGWEVFGILNGFKGLVENDYISLGLKEIHGILAKGGTILGTTNRDNPFHYPINIDGEIIYKNRSSVALKNLQELDIDALIVVGGDGTQSIGYDFAKLGVNVVGVPKTIDNDLKATAFTFGFDTAINISMGAIDRLHTTAESHERIMIVEVMGRNAGWIALYAGLSGNAQVILVPELPYDINKVVQKIRERYRRGKKYAVIVVAEGAFPKEGNISYLNDESADGISKPKRLGGAGQRLMEDLNALNLGYEIRLTILGHLQRGGSPSAADRILGTAFGAKAVELIAEEKFSEMVSLMGGEITSVKLEDAVGQIKVIDQQDTLIKVAKNIGISFGD